MGSAPFVALYGMAPNSASADHVWCVVIPGVHYTSVVTGLTRDQAERICEARHG